jgi:hypothetical protein
MSIKSGFVIDCTLPHINGKNMVRCAVKIIEQI